MRARKSILSLLGCLACLASCQVDMPEDENDAVLEEYSKEFKKQFGAISSEQDWNLAMRGSVTVTVGAPTEVKVYTRSNGKWWLAGKYANVSGTQTLNFDMLKGMSRVKVKADGKSVETKDGGSVDFAAITRAVHTATASSGVSVAQTDSYKYFLREETSATYYNKDSNKERYLRYGELNFESLFPDATDNSSATGLTQVGSGTSSVVSFVLYPAGWNTSSSLTVGLAYDENGTKKLIPIYTIKDSQTDQGLDYAVDYYRTGPYSDNWKSVLGTAISPKYGLYNLDDSQIQTLVDYVSQNTNYSTIKDNYGVWLGASAYQNNQIGWFSPWTNVSTDNAYKQDYTFSDSYYDDATVATCRVLWRSRGIKVTLPSGFDGCLYITDGTTTKYTTTAGVAAYGTADKEFRKNANGYDAVTLVQGNYLGFDWDGDNDMNDVMFLVDEVTEQSSTDETDEPQEFILAAEDLGGTGDFDFNDVVFSVKYVAGQTTATVTPLAAGGTLPVWIYRDGQMIGQELHAWFGVSTGTVYNTDYDKVSYAGPGTSVTIEVPTDFSLTANATTGWGGFSLRVERTDGTYNEVTAPGVGKAPQMICVPSSWLWPRERCNIKDAYVYFRAWVHDHTMNKDWYETPNNEYVVKRETK